ncbi:MAG: hypothetical protein HY975_00705 [Candidatus Kerfeldbacteria bacterium]|nr:hypothetical protein [Candidatus Kerfeldbacteria bacterium]
MESLGSLMANAGGSERRVLQAAHTIAIVDSTLHDITGLSHKDARAVSLKSDTAIVVVHHPAIAAIIYRDASQILELVNDKLRRGGSRQRIRRLSTRVG